MDVIRTKKRAALLSIFSNIGLITSKFLVGIFTGSVSVISEAIHSFTDLLAALIAYFSVKVSSNPADAEHQYGHGKFEDLSGLIEGVLIILAAGYIIYQAILNIISGTPDFINTTSGIIVMFVSVVVNIFVSAHLFKIARKTDSIALLADAQHLKTDVYTSIGVLFGLLLIKITGQTIFDPVIAIIVALFIIKTGIYLCFISVKNLLDTSLPEEERKIIQDVIKNYTLKEVTKIREIKTRKAGSERLIELILIVPKKLTIEKGHNLCDRIENDLAHDMNNVKIIIHLEPCNNKCIECDLLENNPECRSSHKSIKKA